jgi:hypothetical protein
MAKDKMARKLGLSKLRMILVLCGEYSDVEENFCSHSDAAQRSGGISGTYEFFVEHSMPHFDINE